jgi:glycerate kinase
MRVLLAFDKFKDALEAGAACATAAEVLRELHPDWQIDAAPLTDGGEGFTKILTTTARGHFETRTVTGPRGETVTASFGLVPLQHIPAAARAQLALPPHTSAAASVAVIEMAAVSGLALLPPDQRDPWHTSTFGTGELLRAAAENGAAALLLGIGGSATNDLGLGALAALGLSFETADHQRLSPPTPASWSRLAHVSGRVHASLPPIRIACDVTHPLLGPDGCATTFGPQKGLRPDDLASLEQHSARVAHLLLEHHAQPASLLDTPGAGAAGGIAFGLMCAADARLLPGFALVSDWLDLDARIAAADLVITGEGRYDATSLGGKGPGAIVARARSLGKNVHVFAGAVPAELARHDPALHAITPPHVPLAEALRSTRALLASALTTTFR